MGKRISIKGTNVLRTKGTGANFGMLAGKYANAWPEICTCPRCALDEPTLREESSSLILFLGLAE